VPAASTSRLAHQAQRQARPALLGARRVGQHPPRDAEQPQAVVRLGGQHVAAAPGRGEHLGGGVLRILRCRGATGAVARDVGVVAFEALLEALHLPVRS
jgi:hypothetical protein